MWCVSSVSYTIMINGNPTETFNPSDGLRQGDPFSSYLFLLCAKFLYILVRGAEVEGHLHGTKILQSK